MNEEDFPVLRNNDVAYLDSACMSLRPDAVIDAVNDYYANLSSCPGRSGHSLSQRTDEKIANARYKVADIIDARAEDLAFTSGTTESLNLAAQAFKDRKVFVSDKEHNSNLVPWQQNDLKVLNTDKNLVEQLGEKLDEGDVVSLHHRSNLDGSELPLKQISKLVHERKAFLVVDAAQSISHRPLSVKTIRPDVLAFSGHKMLGPTGTGVLYASDRAKKYFQKVKTGGGAVKNTSFETAEFKDYPECVEAGLPNAAGIIGLGAAVKYLQNIGIEEIERHEKKLSNLVREKAQEIEGLRIVGERGSGVFSFAFENVSSHQVAEMLDRKNIAVRSGRHCVHSWFNSRDEDPCFRASLHLYNNEEDVEELFDVMREISVLN